MSDMSVNPERKRNGYYILSERHGISRHGEGVQKKIRMQIREFSKEFYVTLIKLYEKETGYLGRAIKRLPLFSAKRDYEEVFSQMKEPAFIYIRFELPDRNYMRFLKRLRDTFPLCKILIEIPSYPYEKEIARDWRCLPYIWKDRYYRKNYRLYIDRFVIYTQKQMIYEVPCIAIMNGIDVSSVRKVCSQKYNENINLIFVGTMENYHGLERIIRGLARYYADERKMNGKERIIFHCVGDGKKLDFYKKLVWKNKLENKVVFYGRLQGKELDEVYDKADLAVSSMAVYRYGISVGSFLKTGEYLAKGLPVVAGSRIDVFERFPCDFHVDFPNDDSDINIVRIVKFYKEMLRIYENKEKMSESIRAYSEHYIDNSVVMEQVLDYIRD